MIRLDALDLGVAATLVLLAAFLSLRLRLGAERSLVIAAARTVVQLLLVGLLLKAVFAESRLTWIALMAAVMLAVAGYEVRARQAVRLRGAWGYGVGALSMFVSAFSVAVFALTAVIGSHPWYTPQYAIPLLGMLLGNAMTGVALALDRLYSAAYEQRTVIEARLMLGQPWQEAIEPMRRAAARSGVIPSINAMAAAGIVSLPGMMTGQILAGADPVEAVKYQILIMFLIASTAVFGAVAAVWLGSRRLFDARERLRVDRLLAVASR